MAQTFRINLVGPDQGLVEILTAAEKPLAGLGFRRDRSIIRADSDPTDEDLADEEIEVRSLAQDAMKIADWKGAAVEWRCPTFSLGAQIVLWSGGFVNVYVGIDRGALNRLFVAEMDKFYSALIILANACKAIGGFGATGLSFDPVRPDQFDQMFFKDPPSPVATYPLVLFSVATHTCQQVERLAPGEYAIHELPGYWLLVEKAFVEISRMYV